MDQYTGTGNEFTGILLVAPTYRDGGIAWPRSAGNSGRILRVIHVRHW